jgi:hypothetical protein
MQAEVVAFCEAKGWRENDVTFGEAMALLHTEIAEASDAWRRWGLADATPLRDTGSVRRYGAIKPEGVGSEFADVFIRLLDDCDLYKVNLQGELDRQGGLFAISDSFLENMNVLHTMVAKASMAQDAGEWGFTSQFAFILMFLRQLSVRYGIDLDAEYRRKMAYNATRPYRHGGKRQ